MLVRFRVANIFSINEEIEFSMISGKSRQHKSHICKKENYIHPNILKSTIIYGQNSAGKSNFVKAISLAKKIITKGVGENKSLPIKQFRLDVKSKNKPTKFEFEFIHKKKIYVYGYKLDTESIKEEWLYEVSATIEKLIFLHKKDRKGKISFKYNYLKFENPKEEERFNYAAYSTPKNKLFLKESIDRNFDFFKDHYEWFSEVLTIIYPDSKLLDITYLLSDKKLREMYSKLLNYFDTGISRVDTVEYNVDNELNFPDGLKKKLFEDLKYRKNAATVKDKDDRIYFVNKNKENNLIALNLKNVHKIKNSTKEVSFQLTEESDGTQRLFDLILSLIQVEETEKVFIVDEINRSLHPELTIRFFQYYFSVVKNKNRQYIATTHETNLLNLKYFRKDEIWFINRNKYGETNMYSLDEFRPRYDKDIHSGYMNGRFGGVPNIKNPKIINK